MTDVALDDLQPGTANRLSEEGIKVDSLEAANSLVAEYEKEIADRKAAEEEAARAAAEANQPEEPAKGAEGAGGSTASGAQGGTDAQGTTGGSQSASPSSGAGSGTSDASSGNTGAGTSRDAQGGAAGGTKPMTRRNIELMLLLIASPIVIVLFAMMVVTGGQELSFNTLGVPLGIFAAFLVAHIAVRLLAPAADPAILPISFALSGIGIAFVTRIVPDLAVNQLLWLFIRHRGHDCHPRRRAQLGQARQL